MNLKVLLIDHNEDGATLVMNALCDVEHCGWFHVEHETGLYSALRRLYDQPDLCDIILLELGFAECEALTTLKLILAHAPGKPVVVMSANESLDLRAEALILGADDYVIKGRYTAKRLTQALIYAGERSRTPPKTSKPCELCGRFRSLPNRLSCANNLENSAQIGQRVKVGLPDGYS